MTKCGWIVRLASVPLLLLVASCSSESSPPRESVGVVRQPGATALSWAGYDWNITSGGMAGIAPGDPGNVSVDATGYLHLKITKTGGAWTASELYSATNLGFGTYQWQVSGPIDRMDHSVVLGLSPYGPAAGVGTDGYDEIDTEFSWWNDELGQVNMDWGVYPATSAAKHFETDFYVSLSGGDATTTRLVWSSTRVVGTVMSGFQPLGATANVLHTYTYAPPNPNDAIPQQPLPVLLNLWCYKAYPSSGNDVEIVLRDFQFVPEGTPIPDAGVAEAGSTDGGGEVESGTPPGSGPPATDSGAPAVGAARGGGGCSSAAPQRTAGGGGWFSPLLLLVAVAVERRRSYRRAASFLRAQASAARG